MLLGGDLGDLSEDSMPHFYRRLMALQAIHGATHDAKIGLKYTWFGPGYISNMYFKMIANHPKYRHTSITAIDWDF